MNFKVVSTEHGINIVNEADLTICRLVFFEVGQHYQYELQNWLEAKPAPLETRVLIEELTEALTTLCRPYTKIYSDNRDKPWYWVRAEQAVQKAKEWLRNEASNGKQS